MTRVARSSGGGSSGLGGSGDGAVDGLDPGRFLEGVAWGLSNAELRRVGLQLRQRLGRVRSLQRR